MTTFEWRRLVPIRCGDQEREASPLRQAFYDRFGEQITNELLEWFNQVDLSYRTDLLTLNDTNFARFEALLDSRFARADLQLERQLNEQFDDSEQRLGAFEQRWESGDES